MPLVSAVHDDARVLLNDAAIAGGSLFTDAVLLPFTKKAYQEMQDELTDNGISDTLEETDTVIDVAANDKKVTTLPADLIMPLTLWERADGGSDDDWTQMIEKRLTPDMSPVEQLHYWEWREEEIKFVGATGAREIKIRYYKFGTTIVNVNSNIPIINCQVFLAARVAAIAALVIGGNVDRASMYQADAGAALKKIVSIAVKRNQAQPTRRVPFRAQQ